MWRSKKFIFIALLSIVVLAGGIGGVALANSGDEEETEPGFRHGALVEKVCENYNAANPEAPVNCTALEAAFTETWSQMRPEGMPDRPEMNPEAMQERCQELLDEGKITQEQFDRMTSRLEAMPDKMPGFGFRSHGFPRFFGPPCEPAE
ncbi:hypothetical protein ACFLX3_04020 [Chloroflexota bacterium]